MSERSAALADQVATLGGVAQTFVRRPDSLEDAEAIVNAAVEATCAARG